MTQEELAVRMEAEEKKLRKSSWAYHLDRGLMELLAPLLTGYIGPDFTTYVQALEDHARERNWTAYRAGKHLGEVVVKQNLPIYLHDEFSLEDLVGNVPISEGLNVLRNRVLAIAIKEPGKYFELYDQAALEARGIQEICAGLWGLQDGGADRKWVRVMSGYFPEGKETPDWM